MSGTGGQSYFTALSAGISIDQVGGKARNLARVQSLGVQVPKTIVLKCAALGYSLEAHGLEGRLEEYLRDFDSVPSTHSANTHQAISNALVEAGLPRMVKNELADVVDQLHVPHSCGLAVRSSATYEDSEAASFAGVFESQLGVHDLAECERRILECWSSAWAPRAIRYLHRMGLTPRLDGMAVMIQPVVDASSSGVIYTANPDTGDPWQYVVRATPGLAVDLLSGSGVGDSFRVSCDTGAVEDRQIAVKTSYRTAAQDGLQCHPLDGPMAKRPALSDQSVAALSKVAGSLDEAFSVRLDIEFVFNGDDLWIVQARPLTALPAFFPHDLGSDDRSKTWHLAQFNVPFRTDLPAGLTTPLYADLSDAELWSRHQPDDIVLGVFCREERDIHGYRYFLAERSPMFADFFDGPSEYEAWLDRHAQAYQDEWAQYPAALADISRNAEAAISETASAAELIPTMLRIRDQDQDLNSFAWSGPQWLGWMCDMLLGDFVKKLERSFETGPLIGGGMDSYTFRVTQQLQQIGGSIDDPALLAAFETLGLDRVVPELRKNHPGCDFLKNFDAFCWRFGKTPLSWHDRPPFWSTGADTASLMHTVRCALRGISKSVVEAQRESRAQRDEIERELRHQLTAQMPHEVSRFEKMLRWARYWSQALNDRHELAVGLLWERELIWQVGQRLHVEGYLESAEQILILGRQDLEEFAGGATDSFRDLVSERQREWRRRLRLQAPPTLGAVAPETAARAPETSESAELPPTDLDRYTGVGIGLSQATGIARHVPDLSDPALLDALGPDDILVLPYGQAFHYADWHSILTLVTAVVSPGQPSHHLAQVARECGVPVVGQITSDLTAIQDGARLRVDASAGAVYVL